LIDPIESRLTNLVLSYNGADLLRRCLQTLQGQGRVVVIDNGSEDDLGPVFVDHPEVDVLRLTPNRGFAGGYNASIDAVASEYVSLVSNDTEILPGCMMKLVDALDKDQTLGIVGPVLLNVDGSLQEAGSDLDIFGFPIQNNTDMPQALRKAFFVSGCVLVMRKSLFERLHGFTEYLQLFVEDVDLCWRCRLAGYEVAVVPEAVAKHVGGGTVSGASTDRLKNITSERRTYYRERNVPLVFLQNLELTNLLIWLPIYVLNALAETVALFAIGKKPLAKAYVQAFKDAVRLLPAALAARRFVQSSRICRDNKLRPFVRMQHRKLKLIMKFGLPHVR
jgi:GT2 family glycosyltransferase